LGVFTCPTILQRQRNPILVQVRVQLVPIQQQLQWLVVPNLDSDPIARNFVANQWQHLPLRNQLFGRVLRWLVVRPSLVLQVLCTRKDRRSHSMVHFFGWYFSGTKLHEPKATTSNRWSVFPCCYMGWQRPHIGEENRYGRRRLWEC